jgi:hypothetical protein
MRNTVRAKEKMWLLRQNYGKVYMRTASAEIKMFFKEFLKKVLYINWVVTITIGAKEIISGVGCWSKQMQM